jgi:aminocarboxymuconate-semialdehyde decarboxylase
VIIDMHAHIVPERFPAANGRPSAARWPVMDHFEPGRANVMIDGKNFRTVRDVNWNVEKRLAEMDAHGATAEAISPMPELLSYWFTPGDGRDFARYVNEYVKGMVDQAPARLFGLGMVPLQDPDLACRELENVKSLGLLGVMIGSNILGKSLGVPELADFFVTADRLGLAVFVHALHPTMAGRFVTPAMTGSIGFPTDTGISLASLIAGGTAAKAPTLRIAFSHGGGTFPAILPRFGGTWNEAPAPEGWDPHAIARRFYYDTLVYDARAIRYLVDMIGPKQLMIGSDYPYQAPEQPADTSVRSLGLPADVTDDITWHNCFRFLGIPEPAV